MERVAEGVLILGRADVRRLLDLDRCVAVVEEAFRMHGEGRVPPPAVLGVHVEGGGFHTKAGAMTLGRAYFAAKTNANFPGNPSRFGLPTVQGTLVLHDAVTGAPLAVMDAGEITTLRTGAATAVAARHLARPEARVAAVAGAGVQGGVQLRALARVLPLERALLFDLVRARAEGLAAELEAELGIEVRVVDDFRRAAATAAVCVTCTASEAWLLGAGDVRPGTFVAGVGVDAPHKRELDPALLAAATVVVDVLGQCAALGDLHHALAAGAVTVDDVHAELGEIVAGRKQGRVAEDQITVFDSTGMALQDVAAAAAVYEGARAAGVGALVNLAS